MRSNKEQSFNINRIGRYAIRKLSIGAASVLIGITFAIGGPQLVKADTEPASEQVIKTNGDQTQNNNEQNTNATDTDQDIDINLPDKQEDQTNNQENPEDKTELAVSDKDNVLEIKTEKSTPKDRLKNNNDLQISKKNTQSEDNKAVEQKSSSATKSQTKDTDAKDSTIDKNSATETASVKLLGKGPKLSADQLLGAKFEVPSISVGNKTEFENAILSAPTDGTEKLIKLINDINLENDFVEIKNGQNIVITNDNQQRKIMIGNQIRVENGGHLKFKATQKDGIVITRPTGENPVNRHLVSGLTGYENYWSVLDAVGNNAQLTLSNTELTGFHYIYTSGNDLNPTAYAQFSNSIGGSLNGAAYAAYNVGLITITDNAHLELDSANINNNLIYDYIGQEQGRPMVEASPLALRKGGTCVSDAGTVFSYNKIVPGELFHNATDYGFSHSAGAVLVSGGTLIANGSTFKDNVGETGAIQALNIFGNSTVDLHGAKILQNHAYYVGGGIYLSALYTGKLKSTIDNNTQILGNSAGESDESFSAFQLTYGLPNQVIPAQGGGIAVSDNLLGYPSQYEDKIDPTTRRHFKVLKKQWIDYAKTVNFVQLTINGAIISNNYATDAGGGMYVDTNGVTIKKAIIANNDCHLGMGGGIYVSVAPYSIKLNNAVIHDNQAKMLINPNTGRPYAPAFDYDNCDATGSGGGVWLCPTGQSDIKITNGIAIYDNSADVGGDDLWNELKDPNFHSVISNRVLGGGDANWTHDRDSLDKQKFIGPEIGNDVGLKSHLIKDAKRLAEALATVKIYGNIAAWGGGVGSNGGVITNNNNHQQDDKNKDITITKHWVDNNNPERPKSVTIDVIATYKGSDYLVTSFKLSDKNNWTYQLTDLPTNITYDFVEDATGLDINGDGQADYIESNGKITFVRTLGDTSYCALIITNTKKTGNTPTPTPGGSQPTEPQPTRPQPSNPQPTQSQPSNPQPTMPQPSAPQPTKPQTSNIPVHPNKTPKKPKSNITITTNTGKTSSHTPIKSFRSVSHQNKVAQHKVVSSHKQPNKPELPQTGNKKSGMFLTGLSMIILAGLAGALVNHKRRI